MIDLADYNTPGQLIEELLKAKDWSKRVLAIILDTDETIINKIISGNRSVTAAMAIRLEAVFSVSADIFLEIQKRYDLKKAALVARPDPAIQNRARLFGDLPVSEMIKRGWLTGVRSVRDTADVERAMCRFFGVARVDQIEVMPHAAKKTNVFEPASPAQLAWLYRVRQIASEMMVSRFAPSDFESAVNGMRDLLGSPEAARKVGRLMMGAGVRFVIVESLPSAKIDGVCFWLDENSPVIGMSLRHDRIDNFWFVLRHECEHVLRGHGRTAAMLDWELEGERAGVGDAVRHEERDANIAATEFCVRREMMDRFVARKAPFFAERDIIGFANTIGVHPGLVAGQLQRRLDRYDLFRKHLAKIRSVVRQGAMVDGWGDVAPVGA